jgi:predicted DsbA family dithiol-disulfide isomerase
VVHPDSATIPALASCAAHKQGKFVQMEHLIWEKGFNAGRDLSQGNMDKLAGEVGLNMARYQADMKGDCQKVIAEDQKQLAAVGIRGTPGFLINGRFLRGAQPVENFKTIIDEELKKADERIKAGTSVAEYYDKWVMEKGKRSL